MYDHQVKMAFSAQFSAGYFASRANSEALSTEQRDEAKVLAESYERVAWEWLTDIPGSLGEIARKELAELKSSTGDKSSSLVWSVTG